MAFLYKRPFNLTCSFFIVISGLALFLHIMPVTDWLTISVSLLSLTGLSLMVGLFDNLLKSWPQVLWRLFLLLTVVLNAENVLVNGAHLDLAYRHFAGNLTFLSGTLLSLRFLALLLFFGTFFMLALLAAGKVNREWPRGPLIVATAVILVLDFLVPEQLEFASWYQKNPLTFNAKNIYYSVGHDGRSLSRDRLLPQDLNGPLLPGVTLQTGKRPGIILVVLEGFSGDYVRRGLAPKLKAFLDEGLHVPKFLANQVQTNRGLYALFCNDYDNLGSAEAKADIIATKGPLRPCLPELLRNQGYSTLFMQSAPLEFMRKDLFAKASGFDFVAGADSFDKEKLLSPWGVSDGTLMEGAFNTLFAEEFPRPLFLALLTVSTHHPYKTPESSNDLKKAIRYTDKVFGDFLALLRKHGVLNDHLLIVTSDEARAVKESKALMFNHWGLLGLAGPGIRNGVNQGIFSQVDLAMTIADYLGLAGKLSLGGRSALRFYEAPRDIYAGSAFLKRPLLVRDERTVHLCDQAFACQKAQYRNSFFDPNDEPVFGPSELSDKIKRFVKSNDLTFGSYQEDVLFKEKNFALKGSRVLLGDFKTPPGMGGLKYHLLLQESPADAAFSYTVYPCGFPDKTTEKVLPIRESEKWMTVDVPTELKKATLCHSVSLRSKFPLHVETFEFISGSI